MLVVAALWRSRPGGAQRAVAVGAWRPVARCRIRELGKLSTATSLRVATVSSAGRADVLGTSGASDSLGSAFTGSTDCATVSGAAVGSAVSRTA